MVREPRRPLDDETPTEAIPVQEILSRLRAERGMPTDAPRADVSRAGPRRAGAPGGVASSGGVPGAVASGGLGAAASRAGAPGAEPLTERRSPAQHRRPAGASGPASAGPLFISEGAGRAVRVPQNPEDSRGPTATGAVGVTAASTLWILAGIVLLFAAAVVLLAVTVRSLCLDPSAIDVPPSNSTIASSR
ncbi:MAG TPA: hypothetical protein VK735_01490 [Pseudonocardia sp.]|uniref:hypothetical protein n=1 Tax=Pseudonocardia sp. TaxID=60912 RepID=UPI002CC62A04|nr:hypothetical protein [Pseudonocardia sp.]HTF46098.1 hypothetical protein [Pseudonocardia sp.]